MIAMSGNKDTLPIAALLCNYFFSYLMWIFKLGRKFDAFFSFFCYSFPTIHQSCYDLYFYPFRQDEKTIATVSLAFMYIYMAKHQFTIHEMM